MPKIAAVATPENLKPYIFHGVDLDWADGDQEAKGECPFCGKESKFTVNIKTGQWRCFVCATGTEKGGGNSIVFLRKLWEISEEDTTDYEALASDRGLLNPSTVAAWGAVRSPLTGEWLLPGYNVDGNLTQLYRYVDRGGRRSLLATPTLRHGIHIGPFDPDKPSVYVCEGPWDGMALWESLEAASLDGANVVAVPGCNVFNDGWAVMFAGKDVTLMYDSDHPRQSPQGRRIEPVGTAGAKRVSRLLTGYKEPPKSVAAIFWGADGYDPALPDGTDVRDMIGRGPVAERVSNVTELIGRVRPVPDDWYSSSPVKATSNPDSPSVECIPCESYRQLVNSWRKALKWTDGMDCALSVMLASVASTMLVGDQLWVKIIGPASCGKSTLCEAISTNSRYVLAKSTIRGFHSGYDDGGDDNSLISKVKGKTLITKDGDTLLQSPNLSQILSEARDVYDTVSRTSYRNKASKDYTGIRMTWLLCGTSSLRSIDQSELGERFLDCVIMDRIDDDLEDEILLRVANRVARNIKVEVDGKPETQQEPEMTQVMGLTGGYVNYLRENATALMSSVEMPDDRLRQCTRFGKFVAFMRARPSSRQDEQAEREFSARLASQLIRLAGCLAIVMNRLSLDDEVMRRVKKVALDTARGQTLEIARLLYLAEETGAEVKYLAVYTGRTESKTRNLLQFLRQIGAADYTQIKELGVNRKPRWKLSPRMYKLYQEVVEDEE